MSLEHENIDEELQQILHNINYRLENSQTNPLEESFVINLTNNETEIPNKVPQSHIQPESDLSADLFEDALDEPIHDKSDSSSIDLPENTTINLTPTNPIVQLETEEKTDLNLGEISILDGNVDDNCNPGNVTKPVENILSLSEIARRTSYEVEKIIKLSSDSSRRKHKSKKLKKNKIEKRPRKIITSSIVPKKKKEKIITDLNLGEISILDNLANNCNPDLSKISKLKSNEIIDLTSDSCSEKSIPKYQSKKLRKNKVTKLDRTKHVTKATSLSKNLKISIQSEPNQPNIEILSFNKNFVVIKLLPPISVTPVKTKPVRSKSKKPNPQSFQAPPIRRSARLKVKKPVDYLEISLNQSDYVNQKTPVRRTCCNCHRKGQCLYSSGQDIFFCTNECLKKYVSLPPEPEIVRKCAECKVPREGRFFWAYKEFCTRDCLVRFQIRIGSCCDWCMEYVTFKNLGKFSVFFQNNIHQFCNNTCLQHFKKYFKPTPIPNGPIRSNLYQNLVIRCTECTDPLNHTEHTIIADNIPSYFCGKHCMAVWTLKTGLIQKCMKCKVRKLNFAMIQRGLRWYCSVYCMSSSWPKCKCDFCGVVTDVKYWSADDSIRKFCGVLCIRKFHRVATEKDMEEHLTPIPTSLKIKKIGKKSQSNSLEVQGLATTEASKQSQRCLRSQLMTPVSLEWDTSLNPKSQADPTTLRNPNSLINLNFGLTKLLHEFRNLDGSQPPPEMIYHRCLKIQEELLKNGTSDNIFFDHAFNGFTDALNQLLPLNPSAIIEEEYLWETNQLGVASPLILVNTLIYFNCKYFGFRMVEDHLRLTFNDIRMLWTVADVSLENGPRNPIKFYEFYFMKCPEKRDQFYLAPQRSACPDDLVWYTTEPLSLYELEKMLRRLKMVKQIDW